MTVSDIEIVQMLQAEGSRNTGLRHLMQRYQERLYWVIRHIVESHDDTDDVLQNTFIKAYKHIDKFESRSSLFTWLYRIATNEALSHKKSMTRKATVTLPDYAVHGLGPAVANDPGEDEIAHKLSAALNTLPERQRQVFEMRYYQELPYEEIGRILDLSEGALKASYHHAVKKIEQFVVEHTH